MKRVIGLILVLMLCAAGFAAAGEQMTADELYDQAVECFHGEQPDYAKGIEYLEQAAEQWHALHQYNLGYAYTMLAQMGYTGFVEAHRWMTLAAQQSHAYAQHNLDAIQ
jgi:TPR repeat protein